MLQAVLTPCSAVTSDFPAKDLPQPLVPSYLIVLLMALLSLLASRGRPHGQQTHSRAAVTDATDLEFWTASFDGDIFFSAPSKIGSAHLPLSASRMLLTIRGADVMAHS